MSAPTIMFSFSASQHVFEVAPDNLSAQGKQYGADAVLSAIWLEGHGDTVTLISERWKLVAHNMWLVTSPKK